MKNTLTGHAKSQPKKNHFGNLLLALNIGFCITFATFFIEKNQKIVISEDCSEKGRNNKHLEQNFNKYDGKKFWFDHHYFF